MGLHYYYSDHNCTDPWFANPHDALIFFEPGKVVVQHYLQGSNRHSFHPFMSLACKNEHTFRRTAPKSFAQQLNKDGKESCVECTNLFQ